LKGVNTPLNLSVRTKFALSSVVGTALFAVLLWYFGFEKLMTSIRNVSPYWLGLSAIMSIVFYFLRAVRWKILLVPVKNSVNYVNTFWITILGYFVNTLVPVRLGEFLRAFLLKGKEDVGFFEGFSSIVVERVLDLMGVVGIGVAALYLLPLGTGFPPWFTQSLKIVGGIVFIAMICLIIGTKKEDAMLHLIQKMLTAIKLSQRWQERITNLAKSLIDGAKGVSQRPLLLIIILVLTAGIWLIQFLAVLFLFEAAKYQVPLGILLLGTMIIQLSYIFPAAPGFVGSYEAFWLIVFVGLGLSQDLVFAISFIGHIIHLVLITALGCSGTVWMGLSFKELFKIRK